jgi:uncharacterized protein YbcV (DUF1398 family)
MDQSLVNVMHACSTGSINAAMTFPEVVKKLMDIGVEAYHCDLYRREKTYYMPDGQSHVEAEAELDPKEFGGGAIAATFSGDGVKAALTAVQGRQIGYLEFLRRIEAAGCTGYSVFISGRRALYFGRNGESYLEPFPQAK